MNLNLTVIRIDPVERTVIAMRRRFGRNAVADVRKVLRAAASENVGWRKLLDIDHARLMAHQPHPTIKNKTILADVGPTPLIAAGKLDVAETVPKWRLRGCEEHAGLGMLFGQGIGGGMVASPVDTAWVTKRLVWIDGADPAALAADAEDLLPALVPEIRAALLSATDGGPLSEGETMLWLSEHHASLFPAMLALGLTDAASQGRRLTSLGDAVRALIEGHHNE